MERYETKKCLEFMRSLYPSFVINADVVDSWHMVIGDHTVDQFKQAVLNIMKHNTYVPNAAKVFEELQHIPQIELVRIGNTYSVIVWHSEGRVNFLFTVKDEAIELYQRIRGIKTEEILKLHEEMQREKVRKL